MKTHQDIDAEKVRNETDGRLNINTTDSSSGFTGASDLILNADLSYTKNFRNDSGIMATLAYNHYSDKLYAIGNEGKGNLVTSAEKLKKMGAKAKKSLPENIINRALNTDENELLN